MWYTSFGTLLQQGVFSCSSNQKTWKHCKLRTVKLEWKGTLSYLSYLKHVQMTSDMKMLKNVGDGTWVDFES